MTHTGNVLCAITGMILKGALPVAQTVTPAPSFQESNRNTVCDAAVPFTKGKKINSAVRAELLEKNKRRKSGARLIRNNGGTDMIWNIISFIIGGIVGIFIMAVFNASGSDENDKF